MNMEVLHAGKQARFVTFDTTANNAEALYRDVAHQDIVQPIDLSALA